MRHNKLTSALNPSASRQQGVALLTALLVVSLATVAAVAMATRQHVDVRRTGNLVHGEQAYAYALAAESWARVTLRRDARESEYDSLDEDWATALPPIAVEGGVVSGKVEDLQGRFNLNNLVGEDGKASDAEQAYFTRLLDLLGLEKSLADTLTDWIDADIDVRFPDGAEDEHYLLNEPAYRTANRPLTHVSELRLVKGFNPEVLKLLAPHVTALPGYTLINVNTATAVMLQALHSELDQSTAETLLADRGDTGYQSVDDFLGHTVLAGLELDTAIDVGSDYFRILTDVVVGQGQAQLESLLSRADGESRIVYRVRTSIRSAPQAVVVND